MQCDPRMHAHTHTHTHTHTRTRTRTDTHTHTRTHAHRHTRMHVHSELSPSRAAPPHVLRRPTKGKHHSDPRSAHLYAGIVGFAIIMASRWNRPSATNTMASNKPAGTTGAVQPRTCGSGGRGGQREGGVRRRCLMRRVAGEATRPQRVRLRVGLGRAGG
jgi:hypothetical protein